MPCLNEAETLGVCIKKAMASIRKSGLNGEVVIADNGSTDGSIEIAEELGARVVEIEEKGYGNALGGGIEAARGRWIIIGDSDDSYDFATLEPFIEKLNEGCDLVMGCRMPYGGGTISPGAMPWKHRWIGNPALSFIGRLFFSCPVTDFHCGLRAFTRDAFQKMELRTTGMEFASEMVIKATLKQLQIAQVPITLHKDGRSRPPHLRSWRDGWRHLRFMLLYSPRWLFLYPGLCLMAFGILAGAWLSLGPQKVGPLVLDVHSLLYAALAVLIGFETVSFAVFTKIFAISSGLLPSDQRFRRWFDYVTLETGLVVGALLLVAGLAGSFYAVQLWKGASFGPLEPRHVLRVIIPSITSLALGAQVVLSSFFLSVLGLRRQGQKFE
ncbi:MAG TPA: glycosyltransferase family 2 protein [Methylomirabilota bacterium]|nr:glycosyltransferase family 2 protein [Methylomirabilota bacterium]